MDHLTRRKIAAEREKMVVPPDEFGIYFEFRDKEEIMIWILK
jgi:hypothetical protein